MIQRDYIMRLIQQLIDSLLMLLDKKDLDEQEFRTQLDQVYKDYLDNDGDYYLNVSTEDIVTSLQYKYGKEEYLYRIEMLTEIIFQDGMRESDRLVKNEKLSKSLELITYLDTHNNQYSLVREGKIEAIKRELERYN